MWSSNKEEEIICTLPNIIETANRAMADLLPINLIKYIKLVLYGL